MRKTDNELISIINAAKDKETTIHVTESDETERILLIADTIRLCNGKNYCFGFNTDKAEGHWDFCISFGSWGDDPVIQAGIYYVGPNIVTNSITVSEAKRSIKLMKKLLIKHVDEIAQKSHLSKNS